SGVAGAPVAPAGPRGDGRKIWSPLPGKLSHGPPPQGEMRPDAGASPILRRYMPAPPQAGVNTDVSSHPPRPESNNSCNRSRPDEEKNQNWPRRRHVRQFRPHLSVTLSP
ncbi:hypothetical protein ACFOEX_10860, partial [Camelimonas abortus]